MKLQGADCVLAALLGVLFVVNVQGFIFNQPGRQLCEAFGEPCISYDVNSPIGPRCWSKIDFPRERCCNEKGKLQSPIDIPDVKQVYKVPRKLRYSSDKFFGNLENTGIQPSFKKEGEDKVFLEGLGSRPGKKYFISNVHFHVGVEHEERQTENTLNGKSFDGEAHIVHIREDFETLQEAAQHPKGLLVVAVFLKTSDGKEKRSDAFDKLIKILPQIKEFEVEDGPCANLNLHSHDRFIRMIGLFPHLPFCKKSFIDEEDAIMSGGDTCNFYLPNGKCGDRTEATINPNELLADVPEYYFFEGGLTTPPCSEAVLWLVAKEPREVSFFFAYVFRTLETQIEGETYGKFGNLRPLQDREGRKFYLLRFGYRYWKNHSFDQNDARDAGGDESPLAALGIQ